MTLHKSILNVNWYDSFIFLSHFQAKGRVGVNFCHVATMNFTFVFSEISWNFQGSLQFNIKECIFDENYWCETSQTMHSVALIVPKSSSNFRNTLFKAKWIHFVRISSIAFFRMVYFSWIDATSWWITKITSILFTLYWIVFWMASQKNYFIFISI